MKKFLTWVSLGVLLFSGVFAAVTMGKMEPTYNGKPAVSEYELMQDPASYDDSTPDGAAAAIIQQNLDKTHSVNDVTSIVFFSESATSYCGSVFHSAILSRIA